MAARAYLYRGGWVADCPRSGCANTEPLFLLNGRIAPSRLLPGVVQLNAVHCSNCGLDAPVEWPDAKFMDLADAVVSCRPLPYTRNWYPAGHENAVRWGIDHGQTIAELLEENDAHGVAAG